MAEEKGTPDQIERPWPVDPATPGFTTESGNNVHHSEDCPRYQHAIRNSIKYGRIVHPPRWGTTGAARALGKGICGGCWEGSGVRLR